MHITNVNKKIRKNYIEKFDRAYNSYQKLSDEEKMEILIQLTPAARDLLQYGLISNEYVKSYEGKKFEYLRDNRSVLELSFTFLVNEIVEVMTKVFFQVHVARLEYYFEATRNNLEQANSLADFVLFYNKKMYYMELQCYDHESKDFIIKQTKLKALMQMYREGKQVYLLNKYMVGDKVYYKIYDYNEIIKKDLYEKGYTIAGKPAVKITAKGILIEKENAF